MQFSLSLPGETLFGWQRAQELPALVRRYGTRIALVRGGASFVIGGLRAQLYTLLDTAGVTVCEMPAQTREPEPGDVDRATTLARDAGVQAVVAVGGGSVLDLGKAVAALIPQDPRYSVRAYLEGVGEGRVLEADPLPLIAMPTTAGTGSEATKNAVISSPTEHFKKSFRDRRMMADVALIDPALAVALPPALTAHTGLDTLTQLIEAYTSQRAQPVTDALALQGVAAARTLPTAYRDGQHRPAREGMALAAYLSGVCLANAGLGAAHGIAAALGSVTTIRHGLACALALPWVMAYNLPVVAERYAQIAETFTGQRYGSAADGARAAVEVVWQLLAELRIPRAAQLPDVAAALQDERLPELAARCHGNSLRGNPRPLDDDDLIAMLRAMREAESPT
jgi:alcohol dehydrogenase class IV